jgi:hypothetical protein
MGYASRRITSISAEEAEQFMQISNWEWPVEKLKNSINNEIERIQQKRDPSLVRSHEYWSSYHDTSSRTIHCAGGIKYVL